MLDEVKEDVVAAAVPEGEVQHLVIWVKAKLLNKRKRSLVSVVA